MGLIVFIIYIIITLGLYFLHRTNKSESHFFVNDCTSGTFTVCASIVASCIGASATIGVIGMAFKIGVPAFWWLGSGAIGLIVLGLILAPKVRKTKAYTLSEIVHIYLGEKASYISSIIITISWTAIVAAQIMACNALISALTGVSLHMALLISGAIISLHTLLGGQESIMKLDRIQSTFIFLGLMACFLWLANEQTYQFNNINLDWINQDFPISKWGYFTLVLGGGYIVCPMLYGRILSAKNERVAQKGVLWASVIIMGLSIVIVLIGLLSRGLIPSDTVSDQVFITILQSVFPRWLALLTYLVLLSAVISSADSCLFTASATFSRNILKTNSLLVTRVVITLITILAMALTLTKKSILTYLLIANDIYVCSIVIPVFLCLVYSKTKNDINTNIVTSGMILAGTFGVMSSIFNNYYFSYLGFSVSLLSTIAGFMFPKFKITNSR